MRQKFREDGCLEKEVTLIIRVPKDFNEELEHQIDEKLADTLYDLGCELVDSKEYRDIPQLKVLTPVNQFTIIRERPSEHEVWSDEFWVDATKVPTIERFKAAVQDYLKTPEGKQDIIMTSEDFNWGDAMMYVPTEAWNKYGIYPAETGRTLNEMGLIYKSNLMHFTCKVDQDEVLIPDYDTYYWREDREDDPVITPAASLPDGWKWVDYPDGSGSLCSPNGTSFFSYDLAPYSNQGGIECKETKDDAWGVFWGTKGEFKEHAEAVVREKVLGGKDSFGAKLEDAISRANGQPGAETKNKEPEI